jgi:hypothetical protein
MRNNCTFSRRRGRRIGIRSLASAVAFVCILLANPHPAAAAESTAAEPSAVSQSSVVATATLYGSYVLFYVRACPSTGSVSYTGTHSNYVHRLSSRYFGIDLLPGLTQPVSFDAYCPTGRTGPRYVGSYSGSVTYGTDYYWSIG